MSTNKFIQLITLAAGIILSFGWMVLIAYDTNLVNTISCFFNSITCNTPNALESVVMNVPLIIGSILLPLGITWSQKIKPIYKLITVSLAAVLTYYLAFYLGAFLIIAFHGIG